MPEVVERIRFGAAALRLFDAGYQPIPVRPGTKVPAIQKWVEYRTRDETKALVAEWPDASIGIVLGRELVPGWILALCDIDCSDPDLVDQLLRCLPDVRLQRIGAAPRVGVLCRVPVGTTFGTTAKIGEKRMHAALLGPGRQFVAYGRHPLGREYSWPLWSPLDEEALHVPAFPAGILDRLDDVIRFWAEVSGDPIVEESHRETHEATAPADELGPLSLTPPIQISPRDLRRLLALFRPERRDRDAWLRMGMALHHHTAGSAEGLALWDEWSRGVGNYGGCPEAWESFRERPGRQITLKTYLARAWTEHGWRPLDVEAPAKPVESAEEEVDVADLIRRTVRVEPVGPHLAEAENYSPAEIVAGLLPGDAGGIVAPGGMGKTSVNLWLTIHVCLGRPIAGHDVVRPGPVVYITAEDDAATLRGRLAAICKAMGLSEAEKRTVADNVYLVDLSSVVARLVVDDRRVGLHRTAWLEEIAAYFSGIRPSIIYADPVSLLGPGESASNDGMAEMLRGLRWLSRETGNACVAATHHTGQAVAREGTRDQYAGRGGSAFADNSRFILQLDRTYSRTFGFRETEWSVPRAVTEEEIRAGKVNLLLAHKHSYQPVRATPILLVRDGWNWTPHEAHVGEDVEEANEEAQARARIELAQDMREVLDVVRAESVAGHRHTRQSIEAVQHVHLVDLSRTRLRAALSEHLRLGSLTEIRDPEDTRKRWLVAPDLPEGLPEGE